MSSTHTLLCVCKLTHQLIDEFHTAALGPRASLTTSHVGRDYYRIKPSLCLGFLALGTKGETPGHQGFLALV